jgi:hypothetical protein
VTRVRRRGRLVTHTHLGGRARGLRHRNRRCAVGDDMRHASGHAARARRGRAR